MLMMVNVVRACYYCHHCHYDAYDVRMIKKCSCKLGPSVRLSVTVLIIFIHRVIGQRSKNSTIKA